MDNNRLIIAIVIMMAVLFGYQRFLEWRYPNLYGPKAQHGAVSPSPAVATPERAPLTAANSPVPTPIGASASSTGRVPAEITAAPERTVEINTDLFDAILSSRGARLISFRLKKYHEATSAESPYYQTIRETERMPIGLIIGSAGAETDDAAVNYTTDAPARITLTSASPAAITFRGTTSAGLKLEKTFTFRASTYVFDVNAQAAAPSGAPPNGIGLTISQPMTELAGYRDYPEIEADVAGQAIAKQESALKKGVAPLSGTITYAGFGDRYFLKAFMPRKPAVGTVTVNYADGVAQTRLFFPGAGAVATRVFVGPKALDVLEAANPALSKTIDLGWWGIIALPFIRLLQLFYRIVPNYGIAIILLTVLVRLLTLPMSIRGQRSMMKMQRLQPQVERIREKFKDDSERLNREMVDLYKRNHVNPLGGCLPMVVQLPVFIGLYQALLNAVDLRHARFFGWIQDLSAPDCLHIQGMPAIPWTTCHGLPVLVALMTVSTFLQQWLMPRQPDPSQQKMMMFMPLVFSVIFLQLPSGLSLYYLASNLLGIAQQIVLNREFQQVSPDTK